MITGVSEAQVRLQLALRDASEDNTNQIHFEITPSMLIAQGLELEDQQYVPNIQFGLPVVK